MATAHVSAGISAQSIPPSKGAHRQRYTTVPQSTTPTHHASRHDLWYGQEGIARICHRFITFLFTCPDHPPVAVAGNNPHQTRLPYFIAYALHRTKLNQSVTIAALILLQRLKARFPTAKGSSGHRLFISAIMIASKVICDDTYSNKSWSIVAQNIFTLREINQMEREMCGYLDWELNVDGNMLHVFEEKVMADFSKDQQSYPKYDIGLVSKRSTRLAAAASTTPLPESNPVTTTTPTPTIPNMGSRNSTPSKPPQHQSYSPSTPETPSPSYSTSTSPTTSPEPLTPPSTEDYSARIHGQDQSPRFTCVHDMPLAHPLKGKMFAMAIGTEW